MNSAAWVVSECGQTLLLVALTSALAKRVFGSDRAAAVGFAVGMLASVLPLPWNPTFYTRALIGEPGALGWVFLLHVLLGSVYGTRLLPLREARALALPAVVGAVLIYPASLGVPGAPDFYNADCGGFALPTAAVIYAGICLWRGFVVAAAGVGCGLFLYGLDLHESANLWDCLLDFPSVVVSFVILVKWAVAYRRLRRVPDGASLSKT